MKFTTTPEDKPWENPIVGFDSKKAAQIAAFFSLKEKGSIEKLKLMKLMYLSERASLQESGHPMTYDEFYSMKHGPICSNALSGINGDVIDKTAWDKYISIDNNKKDVRAKKQFTRADFNEISDFEIELLESIWVTFGHMSAGEIRNYTHKHCPEYQHVEKGRVPISYRDIFKALGETDSEKLEDEIRYHRHTFNLQNV